MKKTPVYIYGSIIILEGAFLLFSKYYTLNTIKYSLGIALIIGAILGFSKALSRQRKHVEFSYHEMHSLTMLVYGISVLLFGNTLDALTNLTVFLFIFYAFSEIIFCNWLFNLGKEAVQKIVFIRVVLGLIVGVGAIVIMYYSSINNTLVIEGFGVVFIIIGINILLYVPVMKAKALNESFEL